jgi:hypothetical protein
MNLLERASRFRTLALACLALTLMGARADVVTDWNVTALTATEAASPLLRTVSWRWRMWRC